jgi:hypothetical protein
MSKAADHLGPAPRLDGGSVHADAGSGHADGGNEEQGAPRTARSYVSKSDMVTDALTLEASFEFSAGSRFRNCAVIGMCKNLAVCVEA